MYVGKVWLSRSDARLRARGRRLTSAAMKLQTLLTKPYHLGDGWRTLDYPTQYIVTEIPWAQKHGWTPPPLVAQALGDPAGGPTITGLEREAWEEVASSTILWGRSMQKKLLQAAKNAGYVKYRKHWRAMFWTQRKRAHRGVTKEGSSPSLLTLRDPNSGVLEHSEGLKKAVEKGFRETPPL